MGSENTQAIDDVELHLDTGGLYALGRLEPGQSKSVRINSQATGGTSCGHRDRRGDDFAKFKEIL